MSPAASFKEARKRIAAASKSGALLLDLGDLHLDQLPDEIRGLTSLRVLAVGEDKPFLKDGAVYWKANGRPFRDALRLKSRLSALTHLESLDHVGCTSLHDISPLAGLTQLRALDLGRCTSLRDLSPVAGLKNLENLNLACCAGIIDLSPLIGLRQLHELLLAECNGLTDLSPLTGLTQLHELNLSFCSGLTDLSSLASLASLRSLVLGSWNHLTDLSVVSGLKQLQQLVAWQCEQLTDVSALAGLTQLQELHLARCERLSDVSALDGLTQLRELDLSACERLSDLSPVAGLTKLQKLDLHFCRGLTDLSPLSGLAQLRELDLGWCNGLTDLSPLASLTNLRKLTLDQCGQLTDLSALAGLTRLQSLSLQNCKGIRDLSGVGGLKQLQQLDALQCEHLADLSALAGLTGLKSLALPNCKSIRDLSVVSGLKQLQLLSAAGWQDLMDVSALAGLSRLRTLDLNDCAQIRDVSALASLVQLAHLMLNGCTQLCDVSPLAALTNLQALDLGMCHSVKFFRPLVPLLQQLKHLCLFGCSFDDLSAYVCGNDRHDNVIDAVRADNADRLIAATLDTEVKVLLLGNGGVGKTTLRLRLKGAPFDNAEPSTHGIVVDESHVKVDGQVVRLNLWDFGGQDIYHGTHSLFLDRRAIFLLLWTPDRESGDYVDGATTMHHRPLSYWLDYMSGLGVTECPVVIVQSQCDLANGQRSPSVPINGFRLARTVSCSSLTGFGIDGLKGLLEMAVRDLLSHRPASPIGEGRVEVRNRLREMLKDDQSRDPTKRRYRTLTKQQFKALCVENGKISNAHACLEWLHHAGVVFFHPGLFDDLIILDQNWALEAIYALFDRKLTFPGLNRHGRFTRQQLVQLIWRRFSIEEQELFLSMMESCDICFRVRKLLGHGQHPVWEFVAPELLPEWETAQRQGMGRLESGHAEASVEVAYRFLHVGILREFLCRVGRKAADAAEYWKYGCWFFEKQTECQLLMTSEIEMETGAGRIVLWAVGERPEDLAETMLQELLDINCREVPEKRRSYLSVGEKDHIRAIGHTIGNINDEARSAKWQTDFERLEIIANELRMIVMKNSGTSNGTSGKPVAVSRAPTLPPCGAIETQDHPDTLAYRRGMSHWAILEAEWNTLFISRERLEKWFNALSTVVWLKPLQVFWCVGYVDHEALAIPRKALGYSALEAQLPIYIDDDAVHVAQTYIRDVVAVLELLVDGQFLRDPRPEIKKCGSIRALVTQMTKAKRQDPVGNPFRVQDGHQLRAKILRNGVSEWRWTLQGRRAWVCVDKYFEFNASLRPRLKQLSS